MCRARSLTRRVLERDCELLVAVGDAADVQRQHEDGGDCERNDDAAEAVCHVHDAQSRHKTMPCFPPRTSTMKIKRVCCYGWSVCRRGLAVFVGL